MPMAAVGFCSEPGCKVRTSGRCPEHDTHGLYSKGNWRGYSRLRLRRHPWCADCGMPAKVTDHIRPHRGDEALFWNEDNHQSLCKPCHDAKTNRERA